MNCRLVVVGASTGGTVAVESIVRALPAELPPLIIVQHLPQYISGAFARRLDQLALLHVEEAVDGVTLRHGMAVVAPGDLGAADEVVSLERMAARLSQVVRRTSSKAARLAPGGPDGV